jgi:hypothetical protein
MKSLKNLWKQLVVKLLVKLRAKLVVGSPAWLIASEGQFGGFVSNVKRRRVSSLDPRCKREIESGGMTGGDRMIHHGYAKVYSVYLRKFLKKGNARCVAEFGILRGSGLAVWCDWFKDARVIGFDIDLSHARDNWANLVEQGAFKCNSPELHEYDQFCDGTPILKAVFHSTTVDVCIDDGFHSHGSILTTMQSVMPFMSHVFVYFIEDNETVSIEIKERFPSLKVESFGRLTVVSRGL